MPNSNYAYTPVSPKIRIHGHSLMTDCMPRGGVLVVGSSTSRISTYDFICQGAINLQGGYKIDYACIASGAINFRTSPFYPTPFGVGFWVDLPIRWNIDGIIENDVDFSWNVLGSDTNGQPLVFWYRVESEGNYLPNVLVDSGDPSVNSKLMMYTQYLTAINLADLCTKLKEIYLARPLLYWKVRSIRKYLKPLRRTRDADLGEDVNPWIVFENEVGWETVPECMEFTLAIGQGAGEIIIQKQTNALPTIFGHEACYKPVTVVEPTIIKPVAPNINAGMTVTVSLVTFTESVGGFEIKGTSPAAIPYTISPFVIGGTSPAFANHYEAVGVGPPLVVGGASPLARSQWQMTASGMMLWQGESLVTSTEWTWAASGVLHMGGSSGVVAHYVAEFSPPRMLVVWGASTGSVTTMSYEYVAGSPVVSLYYLPFGIGGTSPAYPVPYVASGHVSIEGAAEVESPIWTYLGSGTVAMEGGYQAHLFHTPASGISLGGSSAAYNIVELQSIGGLGIGGEAEIQSSAFTWLGSGEVEVEGVGIIGSSWKGTFETMLGGVTTYVEMPQFPEKELYLPDPLQWTAAQPQVQTKCECAALPQLLIMNNEFYRFGKLYYFLLNNKLTLSDTITLSYSGNTDPAQWQSITHLSGQGLEDGTDENWILRYDWACMNSIENVTVADYTWRYTLIVNRTQRWRRTARTLRSTSRMSFSFVLGIQPRRRLDFSFMYHGDTGVVTDSVGKPAVDQIVVDDIGLLDGAAWLANPIMTVRVAEQPPVPTAPRFPLERLLT